jgi:SAM-dependent methyltransferase
MQKKSTSILTEVENYYTAKILEYGETPRGVDWNSEDSQFLRFDQLSKIISKAGNFSLNDIGCGFGSLLDYLENRFSDFRYQGCDISAEMIRAAKNRNSGKQHAEFIISSSPSQVAEFSVASGIFNVKQDRSDAEWLEYLKATLDVLNKHSKMGFAFNCLTSYSDKEKMRGDLYYADPCQLFDFCKRRYSRHVSLLHDYGLYEFTILVRKLG